MHDEHSDLPGDHHHHHYSETRVIAAEPDPFPSDDIPTVRMTVLLDEEFVEDLSPDTEDFWTEVNVEAWSEAEAS